MNPLYKALLAATIAMASAQASADEWNNPDAPPCLTVDKETCRKINKHMEFRIQELFATCTIINSTFKGSNEQCYRMAVEALFYEAEEMRMMENEK